MRVLGIDCGTERTGWGVIESDGRRHAVIAHGVISLSPRDPCVNGWQRWESRCGCCWRSMLPRRPRSRKFSTRKM